MADITMCMGLKELVNCPLKEECYRFKASASERQSMFVEVPYNIEDKTCSYFWRTKNETKQI